MKKYFLNVDTIGLKMLMLNVVLSGVGIVRAYSWVTHDSEKLKGASHIYVKMTHYTDVQTVGWILFIASIFMFMSEFMAEKTGDYMLAISSFICAVIHLVFGMISVDSQTLPNVYYTTMLIGLIQLLLAFIEVIEIWKMKKS